MSETAADQLRRVLHVIPRVADGEEHPVDELAQLAGVDPSTLIADLNSLAQRFDAPGGFVEGVQISIDERTVSVMASHFLRPMRLTMPELCALELGLAILRAERVDADHSAIDRAIARLRQAITRLPSNDMHEGLRHADLSATADPAHLTLIRAALRARRKIRLAYRRAEGGEVRERVVCPYSLFFGSGMWYIVAHCEENEGLRFYVLLRGQTVLRRDRLLGVGCVGDFVELARVRPKSARR